MTAKQRTRGGVAAAILAAAIGGCSAAQNAGAFGGHESITRDAFDDPRAPGQFLRTGVLEVINEQHAFMDRGSSVSHPHPNISDDYRHFDDCDFDGSVAYINRRYDQIRVGLSHHDPFYAALNFGRALHPAQDFYSHSNWVEIGFPLTDDPATPQLVEGGVTQADLIDLSGAQASLAQRWFAPAGGGMVRHAAPLRPPFGAWDILLGADDWVIPADWEIEKYGRSVDPGGKVRYVPTLIDQHGATSGKLLISGRGSNDIGCNVSSVAGSPFGDEFIGPKHGDRSFGLNKDSADNERGRGALYYPARALAVLQTSYEFCRAVREAAFARPEAQDGLLVATWVKAGANPHPANTPGAPAPRGPKAVTVTIERVEVRNDHEDGGPGQIQLAAALYDSPLAFRRSVHATNTSRTSMSLNTFDRVPRWQLPGRLRLCVGTGERATFALHAWENDGSEARFRHTYDESDDLLLGVQRRLRRDHRTRVITATGRDLIVRYRISRRDTGASPACRTPPSRKR
jgi:hypothetical protein